MTKHLPKSPKGMTKHLPKSHKRMTTCDASHASEHLTEIHLIIIIIILLKQDYKIQLPNNKIQMAWLTSWLVVG